MRSLAIDAKVSSSRASLLAIMGHRLRQRHSSRQGLSLEMPSSCWRAHCPGKKGVYTTTVAPLFSWSVAQARGHRATKAMVYTTSLGKQRKIMYTIGPKRRVYTRDASDPEKKEKEGFHGGGVYFLPCLLAKRIRTVSPPPIQRYPQYRQGFS